MTPQRNLFGDVAPARTAAGAAGCRNRVRARPGRRAAPSVAVGLAAAGVGCVRLRRRASRRRDRHLLLAGSRPGVDGGATAPIGWPTSSVPPHRRSRWSPAINALSDEDEVDRAARRGCGLRRQLPRREPVQPRVEAQQASASPTGSPGSPALSPASRSSSVRRCTPARAPATCATGCGRWPVPATRTTLSRTSGELDRRHRDDGDRRENLVFSAGIAGNLLASEVVKALSGLSAPSLVGRILTVRLTDLHIEQHMVLRKPACPVCFPAPVSSTETA